MSTMAEAGVPGYDPPTWSGVVGPAGIPRHIDLPAAPSRPWQHKSAMNQATRELSIVVSSDYGTFRLSCAGSAAVCDFSL